MGNDGAAVFTRAEEDQTEENSEGQTENEDSVGKEKAMSSCQINAIQDCALFITIPGGKEGISIPI